MKHFLLKTMLLLCALVVGSNAWGQTYEKLTSIANIDATAEYVLGIDGTGFHYSGTSSWGLTALPSAQTPIKYTLTKNTNGDGFTAQATISNTTYYLTVPTSKTFTMSTSSTEIGMGTGGTIVNKGNTSWVLRRNGDSGLRAYSTSTGTVVYFYKVIPAFTLTAESNNTSWGTVEVSGNKITASPATGYRVSTTTPYTVTSGSVTSVAQNGNEFTVTASAACTVRVNFEAIPSHTAQFSINGAVTSATYKEGAMITFPTAPASIAGKKFVGWITLPIDGTTNEAPSFVTSANMGESDKIYYAVYASSTTTYNWQKITDLSSLDAGIYALLTTDGHAFNGSINSSGHGQTTMTAFEFTDKVATSAPEGTCEITFEAVTGGYKMYNPGKGYLYAKANSSGNLAWHSSESSYWKFTSTSNCIYNGNSAYLRSYSNSSFRTYASSSSGSTLVLAEKITVLIYSAYCTSIPSSVDVTLGTNGYATFASPYALDLTEDNLPSGVTAYKAAVDGTNVNFTALDQTIPANTGILLKGAASEVVAIPVAASGTDVDGNAFLVNTSGSTFSAEAGYDYFGLLKNTLTFALFDPSTVAIPANKAYLKVSNAGGVKSLNVSFDDGESTGISEMKTLFNDTRIYNLNGQEVKNPTRGIYIINGKKVFIK